MSSIFTKIINGDIPCYKIKETEHCFAFLDINPLQKGHTLVIPKQEVDELFYLDEEAYSILFLEAKLIASAIKKAFPCNRIGLSVIVLEVPHAHIHLIPINEEGDMNFANTKLNLRETEFLEIQEKISNFL